MKLVLASCPVAPLRRGLTLLAVVLLSSSSVSAFSLSTGSITQQSSGRVSFLHSQSDRHQSPKSSFIVSSPPPSYPGSVSLHVKKSKSSQEASRSTRTQTDGGILSSSIVTDDAPAAPSASSHWTNSIVRKGRVAAATACTMGALLFSPLPSVHFDSPSPPSANQEHAQTYQLQLPTTLRFTNSIDPAMAAVLSPPTTEKTSTTATPPILNEVWNLIDKYYIDRTFHDQDWPQTRTTYTSKLQNTDDDDEVMRVTSAMVFTLGDKYSRTLDRASYARIQKFDLIGIGAMLMPDINDPGKKIMVGAPPVAGSAAEKAGMKYGDYIVAVNGVETKGRTAFDIIDQIGENPEAESVIMTVLTVDGGVDGQGLSRDMKMSRQFEAVKNPISFKMSERRGDGTNVGYIRVSEFNSLVKSRLETALKSLEEQGANAYVLDMRSNPGGAFQSAVEIAGLFMDDKMATTVVDSNDVKSPFRTTTGKVLVDKTDPIVIWMDNRSASATEVFAGALHDQCRAVVMGPTNSFGKGLIQAVYGLQNGGGLVLTVARYVTPNGTDIQGKGIAPDINTKLPLLLSPSDTSKVDFVDISARLKGGIMCSPESKSEQSGTKLVTMN